MKRKISTPTARELFARNLRGFRRYKDISQEELALKAEMSRSYVSGVERGERNVSIDNMGALAKALDVSLQDLLDPKLFSSIEQR